MRFVLKNLTRPMLRAAPGELLDLTPEPTETRELSGRSKLRARIRNSQRFDAGASPVQLRLQYQQNPVADEVSAITAVVRPILEGLLYALKADVVAEAGGYENVKLKMLPRLYRPGDRDCGICFEYAVHDALNRGEASVVERLHDAMINHCNVPGDQPASILFGVEKTGALNLIDTVKERLTEESRLLAGVRGQPAKLKRHIDAIAAAFRKKGVTDLCANAAAHCTCFMPPGPLRNAWVT